MIREEFKARGFFEESVKKNALAHGIGTRNMLEETPHSGRKPYMSFINWGVHFPYLAQCLRSKKFDYPQVSEIVAKDVILQRTVKLAAEQIIREERLSKPTFILDKTRKLKDEDVEEIVENDSNDNDKYEPEGRIYKKILRQQERRAMSILKDMRSTLNNFLLALTSWLMYKLLPCFLTGVVTHTEQIQMLKSASEKAPGIPLIFLPLHRSHLDYIMVTFILMNNDIRSPLVAAGNNLQIPVFGSLLRGLGAFFIKRRMDPIVGKKDILYRAILHLYLQHALKMGHNVEFFIEGGRTRTGKPCMPKGGILSVIVNAFMDGSIPDALLVPVSVNYERLVDGNFVLEQKGEKKAPESFSKAMSGIWKALNSNYGLMRIDFNEPYSIRELVQSYNKILKEDGGTKMYKPAARTLQHNQSTSSLYGTDVICEEHRNLIDSISRQVVFDCAAATSVMSTNALAFLLLTRFRSGATGSEIAKSLDDLRFDLNGKKDMGFSGDSMHIINYACDLLGKDLIVHERNENNGQIFVRPVLTNESFIELSYYSNMLTPHFALKSILMITFHTLLRSKAKESQNNDLENNTENQIGVLRHKVLETALNNCDIFRYEYILHKPTQNLENILEQTLNEMTDNHLMNLPVKNALESGSNYEEHQARRLAAHLFENEFDDDYQFYNNNDDEVDETEVYLCKETLVDQKALCEVLAPFSNSYLSVAESLNLLYKNPMLETEFIKHVITDLLNKVKCGKCEYAESLSTDSVRNCLKLLEKWSVIEICNQHGVRLLSLSAMYDNSKESLKPIIQRIYGIVPNYNNGYLV